MLPPSRRTSLVPALLHHTKHPLGSPSMQVTRIHSPRITDFAPPRHRDRQRRGGRAAPSGLCFGRQFVRTTISAESTAAPTTTQPTETSPPPATEPPETSPPPTTTTSTPPAGVDPAGDRRQPDVAELRSHRHGRQRSVERDHHDQQASSTSREACTNWPRTPTTAVVVACAGIWSAVVPTRRTSSAIDRPYEAGNDILHGQTRRAPHAHWPRC